MNAEVAILDISGSHMPTCKNHSPSDLKLSGWLTDKL